MVTMYGYKLFLLYDRNTKIVKWTDLVQVELDGLIVFAAFIWYQQVGVFISQGSDL